MPLGFDLARRRLGFPARGWPSRRVPPGGWADAPLSPLPLRERVGRGDRREAPARPPLNSGQGPLRRPEPPYLSREGREARSCHSHFALSYSSPSVLPSRHGRFAHPLARLRGHAAVPVHAPRPGRRVDAPAAGSVRRISGGDWLSGESHPGMWTSRNERSRSRSWPTWPTGAIFTSPCAAAGSPARGESRAFPRSCATCAGSLHLPSGRDGSGKVGAVSNSTLPAVSRQHLPPGRGAGRPALRWYLSRRRESDVRRRSCATRTS